MVMDVTPAGTVHVCMPPVKLKVAVNGVGTNTGVTTTVATTGALVTLVAVKLAILPVPLAARPMDGALFVQLNMVPGTVVVKLTAAVGVLLHTTWLAGWFTWPVGLTVIVNVIGVPTQETPLVYVGVTVMVAVTGAVPALVAVKAAILPAPAAARPIDGVLFTQL